MSKASTPIARADLGSAGAPRKPRIVAWGELLWDLFPEGAFLGGSAANVAYHAAFLGGESRLVSAVGNDSLGVVAVSTLQRAGVITDAVTVDNTAATGRVRVTLVNGEPQFTIEEGVAWDKIVAGENTLATISQADVFCFSTLAQRTPLMRTRLRSVLAGVHRRGGLGAFGGARAQRPLCVLDLNLRPPFIRKETIVDALRFADVVKLNEAEAAWIKDACGCRDPVTWLLSTFNLRLVALTRGEAGASLFTPQLRVHGAAPSARGGDPVGAGDAFVAALSVALGRGESLPRALECANRHGAWVAGRRGAMPARL